MGNSQVIGAIGAIPIPVCRPWIPTLNHAFPPALPALPALHSRNRIPARGASASGGFGVGHVLVPRVEETLHGIALVALQQGAPPSTRNFNDFIAHHPSSACLLQRIQASILHANSLHMSVQLV